MSKFQNFQSRNLRISFYIFSFFFATYASSVDASNIILWKYNLHYCWFAADNHTTEWLTPGHEAFDISWNHFEKNYHGNNINWWWHYDLGKIIFCHITNKSIQSVWNRSSIFLTILKNDRSKIRLLPSIEVCRRNEPFQ